jgi:cytochrome b involved in lipid metabolism
MSKAIIFVVVIIIFLLGGLFVWATFFNSATAPTTSETMQKTGKNPASGSDSITKEEVARHTEKESCWFITEGKVYDFSPFLNAHPKLVYLCGKDVTADFVNPPLLVGVEEMNVAREALPQFYIGEVAQ